MQAAYSRESLPCACFKTDIGNGYVKDYHFYKCFAIYSQKITVMYKLNIYVTILNIYLYIYFSLVK